MMNSKKLIALVLLFASSTALADVYPGPGDATDNFVKITHDKSLTGFELCETADPTSCSQLGKKQWYTDQEIQNRRDYYSSCESLTGIAALLTGGLSLLGTADCYLKKQTLNPSLLKAAKYTLTYSNEKQTDGTYLATGTMAQFADRIATALGDGTNPSAAPTATDGSAAKTVPPSTTAPAPRSALPAPGVVSAQ